MECCIPSGRGCSRDGVRTNRPALNLPPEFGTAAQLGKEAMVGGGEGVFGEAGGGYPGQFVAQNRLGFVFEPEAMEEFDSDGTVRVIMGNVGDQVPCPDFDAQLFAKLTPEALAEGFPMLAFPSRKFPKPTEVGRGRTAGDEEFAVAKNQARRDLHRLHFGG